MNKNRVKLTFFDDYWVDFRMGTTRRWFTPELYSVAPTWGYSTIIADPERNVYRIYYEQIPDLARDSYRLLKMVETPDMKTFTPVLNDRGTDVIFDGEDGLCSGTVLYDRLEQDPARRYKYCGMTRTARKADRATQHHVETVMAFSPDGIHWEHRPELVANPHTSDCLNKLFYNPYTEEYVLTHRAAYVDRRISVRTSRDLKNWSESRTILHPGALYNSGDIETQHYSMTANYFDGIFYGLLWCYSTDLHNDRDVYKMYGVMDTELVYSYDGKEFLYTTGKPLVERPYPPHPGWAGMGANDMCESLDGRYYYIIMFSYQIVHGTADSNKRLTQLLQDRGIEGGQCIYRIRKDGFCGIESVGHGAKVITKPMELLDDDLTFNLRADCGSVRFGLMTLTGKYLDGFSPDDCIPFEFSQGIEVRPRWKEKQLSEALHKQVRVVIELNGAILHAMSATARPYIRQPQRSFADPQGMFEN